MVASGRRLGCNGMAYATRCKARCASSDRLGLALALAAGEGKGKGELRQRRLRIASLERTIPNLLILELPPGPASLANG